jgi:hypothetical protein
MKWSHWNEEEIADIKLIIKTKGISDITSMDTCSHLFWWVEEISENVGEYDHYKNLKFENFGNAQLKMGSLGKLEGSLFSMDGIFLTESFYLISCIVEH